MVKSLLTYTERVTVVLWTSAIRVSARKKFMGGGQLENTNLLKKGDLSSEHFLEGLH